MRISGPWEHDEAWALTLLREHVTANQHIFGMALAHWFWQEGVSRLGAARAGHVLDQRLRFTGNIIRDVALNQLAIDMIGAARS